MAGVSLRSDIAPFEVMEVLASALERQRSHGDLISLCVGQPSTPAPAVVREAARHAVDHELLGYTEAVGLPALREAIAAHHRAAGISVTAEDVVVTTGSSGGFGTVVLAAFDAGDTVVVSRPGYPAYRHVLQAMGCRVLELPCGPEVGFQPTLEMLTALPERPAGVVVASPANPTGTLIDPEQLDAIARWCAEQGVRLISDEIYHHITFGRPARSAWASSTEAVVIGSVSKYFSMTGWRLGWVLAPPDLRRRVALLSGNLSLCPPTLSQHAAVAAFTPSARAELDDHVARYAQNRAILLDRLPGLRIAPLAPCDGAFYLWCSVARLTDDARRWCAQVLERTGVAIAPGTDFDPVSGHQWVRISFAGRPDEMHAACDRLQGMINGRA